MTSRFSADAATLAEIWSHYPEDAVGTFVSAKTVEVGLIHGTYCVTSTTGRFSLQRLHPKLASDGVLADYRAVTSHLAAKGFPAPQLIPTRDDRPALTDTEQNRWRVSTWLAGKNTSVVRSTRMVESAARLWGRFHHAMRDLSHTFQSTHPLHDTLHHLESLRAAVRDHSGDPWLEPIRDMVEVVERTLPDLLLPADLPQLVVHGDPKISNLLFDDDHQAVAVLDLDTCTHHTPLVDLGDAIRSWCILRHKGTSPGLSLERYAAIMRSYAAEGPPLDAASLAWLPKAGWLITLELASRFLTDVLRDEYFAWDANAFGSRREHNRHRAQTMIAFAQKLEQSLPQQQEIVESIFAISA